MARYSVLFVCLGNICRSPLAEGVFKDLLHKRNLTDRFYCESRGTGNWHAGDGADNRMIATGKSHGIDIGTHRAKQVSRADFSDFSLVLAMDRFNLRDLKAIQPPHGATLKLFRDYDPMDTDRDVPDPYHGGPDGFEDVYNIVRRCCENLLETLVADS